MQQRVVNGGRDEVREEETHRISSALEVSDVDHRCIRIGLMRLAASHLGARRLFSGLLVCEG